MKKRISQEETAGRQKKTRFVFCEQCGKRVPEEEYDTCGCVCFSCAFDNMGD